MKTIDDDYDQYDLPEVVERFAQNRREYGFAESIQVPLYTYEIAPDVFAGLPFTYRGKKYTYAGRDGDKQKNIWKLRFVVSE